MALRLVRETSDTPNVTNKDDTIMTRYAYGGYNGVVKGFGSECGYTAENGIFKVLDGRIVLDGWEIEVDGAGWSLNLSSVTGTQYYSIYLSIYISIETAVITSTYLQGVYPEITKGDDLTTIQNGTARLLLYNVKVENGRITEVIKRFEIIPYLTQKVLDIEKRLEELGFKQGVAGLPNGVTASTNSLKKQGNYVIFNLVTDGANKITIPEGFRPADGTGIFAWYSVAGTTLALAGGTYTASENAFTDFVVVVGGKVTHNVKVEQIRNAGWEIDRS